VLVPLQTSGSKPPLFVVHGMRGIIFSVGPQFARMLGPDQPVYGINANGLDGQLPVIERVSDMVVAYLQEIRQTRSEGRVRIGGICAGCMVAIEVARKLQDEGRQTGPVILVDPPVLSVGYEKRDTTADVSPEHARRFRKEVLSWILNKSLDPTNSEELPFDPRDPNQMNSAVALAVRTTIAFARHIPRQFSGPVDVIMSESRAAAFLHPQMPWRNLLPGLRVAHVLRWHHWELLRSARKTVARLVKSMLEEESAWEIPAERQIQPVFHPNPE